MTMGMLMIIAMEVIVMIGVIMTPSPPSFSSDFHTLPLFHSTSLIFALALFSPSILCTCVAQ